MHVNSTRMGGYGPEDVERWKALRVQGIPVENIARRAGLSKGRMYRITAGVETGEKPSMSPRGYKPTKRGHRRRAQRTALR